MSNTTNLNLFKHDNPEQNTNPFDVEEALNKNWDKVDNYAGNVNEDITTINSAIENINRDITDIQTEQTTQNENIQENADNISSLVNRVGTNENSISNINTTIGTIQTEQTTQNNKISALETDNTTNKTNIATLQTDSGHTISLDLNTTTYVLTATLKNKAGTTLNTSSIDLPVEQLVVSVSYDKNTKELVITLKNGEITRVPLGDLVSGLQTEITSSNKLSSDLVDDTNHTHKFVSAGEKETWNAKYNKPSGGIPKTDLTNEVQTSLGKADTALQQHQDISGKEDKSNKVTSIDDESTDIQYPSAKCVYDSQQNQNAKIVKLELENQRLKQTLATTSGTGENITLNKTAELDFVVPPLPEGNIVQDGEPTPTVPVEVQVVKGDVEVDIENKNFFDKNNVNSFFGYPSPSTHKLVVGGSTDKCLYIRIKPNQTYTIQKVLSSRFYIATCESIENGVAALNAVGNNTATQMSITSGANDTYLVVCYYLSGTDTLTEQEILDSIQIELGSTVSPYTPHQEQTLPLNLPVENLWSLNNSYSSTTGNQWVLLDTAYHLDAGTYTISFDATVNKTVHFNFKDANNTSHTVNVGTNATFTTAVPLEKVAINITSANNTISNIQIEPGSKANHYTPYGTTPIELCKIGDYKDYPWKDLTNGKWYWHKRIEKIVLDGSENWDSVSSYIYALARQSIKTHLANSVCFSDMYIYVSDINVGTYGIRIGNAQFIQIRNTDINNVNDFKTWLSTHNTSVYYILQEPVLIEITDTTLISQLEAIYNTISYYEQTNISGTSSGINPLFDVEAYQSTKLLLEDIINSN